MLKTILTVLAVVGVVAGGLFATYVIYFNYGNTTETQIVAEYTDMENILATGGKKVKEVAQVPGMKADDLSRVMKEAMSGRYGSEGSKATMQWITENYPGQVSDALYTQIQQVIESYRDKFESHQRMFIEVKRSYTQSLGSFWGGYWLAKAGYPKIDLKQYVIISSSDAQKAFRDKVEEPIELRNR